MRGKRVPYCTCGTWDHIHEPQCGYDVDDNGWPNTQEGTS